MDVDQVCATTRHHLKAPWNGTYRPREEMGRQGKPIPEGRTKAIWSRYKELADRLNKHGMEETETSITGKLARGTFAASFLLACLAVLEIDGIRLEDI